MKFSTLFKKITASGMILVNLAYPVAASAGQYVGMVRVKDLVVDSGGTLPVVNIDTSNTSTGSVSIGGARLKVAPSSASFGSVAVGTTSIPQTITLSNLGAETAVIGTIPDAGPFQATDNCNGVSLPPLATCRFNLQFSPTQVALNGVVGTINVPLTTATAAGVVPVTGTGVAYIAPNPETLKSISIQGFEGQDPSMTTNGLGARAIDAGVAIINAQSVTKTFTVTSNGGLPVAISTPTLENSDGSFQVSSNCPVSLSVGQSCTVSVVYEPTTVGVKTATLYVNSGAYEQNAIPIELAGEAIDLFPIIGPSSTTSVDFGNRMVGAAAVAKTVTLYNTGTAPLNVGAPSIQGTQTTGLSVLSNGCTAPVAIGSACAIQVQLSTAAESALSAKLVFTHNGRLTQASPLEIPLLGAVMTAPHVVAYSELAFGSIPAQTDTAFKYAIIENTATDLPVQLTGPANDAVPYTSVSASTAVFEKDGASLSACFLSKTELQPGERCYVSMKLTPSHGDPSASGAISGFLSIPTNLPSGALKVPYSATFVPAQLSVDVSSVVFANDTVSTTAHVPDMPVVFTNTGVGKLVLSPSNWATTGNFAIVRQNGTSATTIGRNGTNLSTRCEENTFLEANQSCTLMLRFLPEGAAGLKTGTLVVDVQLPTRQTSALPLSGKALAGKVTLSATTLDLGSVLVGSTSQKSFIVGNNGDTPLSLRNFVRSTEQGAAPSYATELTAAHNCPASLAPGDECTVTVTFSPDQNLDWGALSNQESFRFEHFSNGVWGVSSVPLAGTGYGSILTSSQHAHNLEYVETTLVPQNYTTQVTFTASGPAPVRITGATLGTKAVLETYAGGTCAAGMTLQPGDTCTLNVRNKANFNTASVGGFSTLDQVLAINGTYHKEGAGALGNKTVQLLSEGTYVQEIAISEINPRAINVQVPAYASLHSSGIRPSADVRLDGEAQPYEYVSPTEVRLTIPAGLSVGTHTITVENHDGRNAAFSKTFEVQAGVTSTDSVQEVSTYALDRGYLDGASVIDSLVLDDGRIAYLTSSRVYLMDSANKLLSKTAQFNLGHTAQYLKMSARGTSISVAVAGLDAYAQSPHAYQSDTVTTVQLSLFTVNAETNTLALGNTTVRNLSGNIIVPYGAGYSLANGSIGVSRGASDTALAYAFTYTWGGTYAGTMLWASHTTPGTAIAPSARTGVLGQVSVARTNSNVYARFGDKLHSYSVTGSTLTAATTVQYASQLSTSSARGLEFDGNSQSLFTSCYADTALCAIGVSGGSFGGITKITGNAGTAGFVDGAYSDARLSVQSVNKGPVGKIAVGQSSVPQAVRLIKAVPVSVPRGTFSEPAVAFTPTPIGETVTRTLTLTSDGYSALDLTGSVLVFGDSAITVQGTSCTYQTLNVGGTCQVTVAFTPESMATVTGELRVGTSGGYVALPLQGYGLLRDVSVSATALNFGDVRVAEGKSLALTITNTGNLSLTNPGVSVAGVNFSASHNCPANLSGGASCVIQATASPTATGTINGSLEVTFADAGFDQAIPLTANGIYVSSFSSSSTSVNISNVAVGGTGSRVLTLTNTGNTTLSGLSAVSTNTAFATSNTCTSLLPGASCTLSVVFTPVAVEAYTGTVTVSFAGANTVAVAVSGGVREVDPYGSNVTLLMHMDGANGSTTFIDEKGATFASTLNPVISSTAKFGTGALRVGANGSLTSAAMPFSTVGTGDFTMEFFVRGETPGTLNGNFDQVTFDLYPIQLGVPTNGSLHFEKYGLGWNTVVSGTPLNLSGSWTHVAISRQNGASRMFFNGTLVATSAALNGVDISQSTGLVIGSRAGNSVRPATATWLIDELRFTTGVSRYNANFTAPTAAFSSGGASVTPSGHNFGAVELGTTATRDIVVQAGAEYPLEVTANAAVTGNSSLQLQSSTCVAGVIAAGQTCTIRVGFTPTTGQTVTGQLSLMTNEGQIAVSLSGKGAVPDVNVSSASLTFGNVSVGSAPVQSIVVSNTGGAAATTPVIGTTGTGYSAGHNCGASLAAGSTCTINVTFAPTAAQNYPGSLSIAYAGLSTQTISLNGAGTITPSFSISTSSLAYGTVNTGSSSALSVVVTNNGNVALSTPALSASGSGYSAAHNCPSTFAIGASCTLTVTLTPTASQAYNGTFSVNFAGQTAKTGTMAGTGLVVDNNASSVKLLLHFDGNATDASGLNSLTAVGSATTSTVQKKFGTAAASFTTNNSYYSIPDTDSLALSGDFTVEAWVYMNGNTNSIQSVVNQRSNMGGSQFNVVYQGGKYYQWSWIDGTHMITYGAGIPLNANTWYHLAWVRSGTSFKTFVNGTLNLSSTFAGTPVNLVAPITVGGDAAGYGQQFYGYIDEVRVTKGVARYSTSFTAPTAAFP